VPRKDAIILPLAAGTEAKLGVGSSAYVRHYAERTLLCRIVKKHDPAFKAHLASQDADLPAYVAQTFEVRLECGRLARGLLRARCDCCHAEHLVVFGGKHNGFCASCAAQRMAESLGPLVDEVFFPAKAVRQRVPSVAYQVSVTAGQAARDHRHRRRQLHRFRVKPITVASGVPWGAALT
jgi:hypothetical protein